MFERATIISEIARTAQANGGTPLGRMAFERLTGIREHDWLGKYWARWSDAVVEAGYQPNTLNRRLDEEQILSALADEIRRLGRFPTYAELKMRKRRDPSFPSHNTLATRGKRAELARQIMALSVARQDQYDDLLPILTPLVAEVESKPQPVTEAEPELGQVYLLKIGKNYKIGRSNAFGRRARELAIQMPEAADTIHVISTDDPVGIEAYWHRRFAAKRVRRGAEWFTLSRADVAAFKRRTFQ